MSNATLTSSTSDHELRNRELQREINALRKVDNVTNWFYLAREYVYLAVVLGAALAFCHYHAAWGLGWPWLVPVTLVAIVLVGIGQHRLVMLGHESSHYTLFANPMLNECVSNWFCMYPVWSMTYNYRLQHLAHHQFTNDPERDPDLVYMNLSGHRFHYPMPLGKFLWDCVAKLMLWVPGLVLNVLIRAKLSNEGGATGPYKARQRQSMLLRLIHLGCCVAFGGFLAYGIWTSDIWLLTVSPIVMLTVLLSLSLCVPKSWYMQTAVKPSIAPRWTIFQRYVFVTLLFSALAWLTYLTGKPWPIYYLVLWLVPIGTVFSFLMLLREEIQHSNTPPVKFLDSRNFRGNGLVTWAVFPYQQSYHLPHHLFPMIPHYNLPKLDELLRTTEVYRTKVVDVEGYLFRRESSPDRR